MNETPQPNPVEHLERQQQAYHARRFRDEFFKRAAREKFTAPERLRRITESLIEMPRNKTPDFVLIRGGSYLERMKSAWFVLCRVLNRHTYRAVDVDSCRNIIPLMNHQANDVFTMRHENVRFLFLLDYEVSERRVEMFEQLLNQRFMNQNTTVLIGDSIPSNDAMVSLMIDAVKYTPERIG